MPGDPIVWRTLEVVSLQSKPLPLVLNLYLIDHYP
jgi:hypothetical protein